jgi:hypothetical protein
MFRRNISPPFSRSKSRPNKILVLCFYMRSRWFLARIFFRPWSWSRYVPPKLRWTSNGLHGVITQKIVLFIIVWGSDIQQGWKLVSLNILVAMGPLQKTRWTDRHFYRRLQISIVWGTSAVPLTPKPPIGLRSFQPRFYQSRCYSELTFMRSRC